jgi:NAD(P)-dependent dehydrogenase (short-subunit alcohol dehydrogenase family)
MIGDRAATNAAATSTAATDTAGATDTPGTANTAATNTAVTTNTAATNTAATNTAATSIAAAGTGGRRPVGDRPVVLVTGGARGIGAAVARLAATTGAAIVVNYASSAVAAQELVAELGNGSIAVQADVADEAQLLEMFACIDATFGRLDVLVNNAGIAGGYGSLDVVTAPMLARLFAVNVGGAFVCAREAATRMRTDRGGRGGSIVNISSKAAVLGGSGEWVHYAATKGALDTMTSGIAKELAPFGVRVNTVRPGLIKSDFHLHAPEGRVERMAPMIPMLRSGSAAEVAEAVVWLASPAASYVTGAFIDVAGGR